MAENRLATNLFASQSENREDSLVTRPVLLIFWLELEISGVAVQRKQHIKSKPAKMAA